MVLPGETLLLCEIVPALFAAVAANEAERVAPGLTLVDVQMIGAAGRLYMAGATARCASGRSPGSSAVLGVDRGARRLRRCAAPAGVASYGHGRIDLAAVGLRRLPHAAAVRGARELAAAALALYRSAEGRRCG